MLDYRWALGPGFGNLVVSGGVGSVFGQSRASLATDDELGMGDDKDVSSEAAKEVARAGEL